MWLKSPERYNKSSKIIATASGGKVLLTGSDPGKHLAHRVDDKTNRHGSRETLSGKLQSPMKQEPLEEDEEDCYMEERIPPSSTSTHQGRVRSHARSLRAMANPSAVWAHFDLCVNDALRAQCRICGSVVVRGGANPRQCGTTNLHRHLRVHHGGRLIGRRYHGNLRLPTKLSRSEKIKIFIPGFKTANDES